MAVNKVLVTGAAGYVASQMLPTFRQLYDLVLLDVTDTNGDGQKVEGGGSRIWSTTTGRITPTTSRASMRWSISASRVEVAR